MPYSYYFDWVKRLGQWHLAKPHATVTICGRPMLGNNYEKYIPKDKREKCWDCWEVIDVSDRD